MKSLLSGLVLMVSLVAFEAQADLTDIEGWRLTSEIASYPPEKLWEVINGAAEQYLAYGVQELRTCDLAKQDLAVTVMIFEMASSLEAFGIYKLECPTGAETLASGGAASLAAPYQAVMLKNRYYVKVDAYEGKLTKEICSSLLTDLAAKLPGTAKLPDELNRLPESRRVQGSEGYVARGFLGLNELNGCLHASYTTDQGKPYQVFLLFPDPGETVTSTWLHLAEKWQPTTYGGKPVLSRQVPYQGLVGVLLTSTGIVGAAGAETQEHLYKIYSTCEVIQADADE